MSAESLSASLTQPPELVAAEVRSWLAAQYRGATPLPASDYLVHAVRKPHVLRESHLVAADPLQAYLADLQKLLLEQCPEDDRASGADAARGAPLREDTAVRHDKPAGGGAAAPSYRAVKTKRQVVALGNGPAERTRRFSDLVETACDEFSSGSLGRA